MKILIWVVAAIVALLLTGFVATLASAVGWLASLTPGALESMSRISQWPVPAWLALWLDPVVVERALGWLAGVLQTAATEAPWLTSLLGWVVPVLWSLWALVMLCLLVVTGLVHALVSKSMASSAP